MNRVLTNRRLTQHIKPAHHTQISVVISTLFLMEQCSTAQHTHTHVTSNECTNGRLMIERYSYNTAQTHREGDMAPTKIGICVTS